MGSTAHPRAAWVGVTFLWGIVWLSLPLPEHDWAQDGAGYACCGLGDGALLVVETLASSWEAFCVVGSCSVLPFGFAYDLLVSCKRIVVRDCRPYGLSALSATGIGHGLRHTETVTEGSFPVWVSIPRLIESLANLLKELALFKAGFRDFLGLK